MHRLLRYSRLHLQKLTTRKWRCCRVPQRRQVPDATEEILEQSEKQDSTLLRMVLKTVSATSYKSNRDWHSWASDFPRPSPTPAIEPIYEGGAGIIPSFSWIPQASIPHNMPLQFTETCWKSAITNQITGHPAGLRTGLTYATRRRPHSFPGSSRDSLIRQMPRHTKQLFATTFKSIVFNKNRSWTPTLTRW